MSKSKISISQELLDKIRAAATTLGVSEDELIERTLQKEVQKVLFEKNKQELSAQDEEKIVGQLKGLGYLE